SENQNTIKIEKKECEKAMMIENYKELQRKVELKKEQLKKENVIESQKKAKIQKKQLKKENVIESQKKAEIQKKQLKKENAIEKVELQIKQLKLLDCADEYVADNSLKKVIKDKKRTAVLYLQSSTTPDKHDCVVSKQKDDGSFEISETVCKEIDIPVDVIPVVKKETEKELLDCTDKYDVAITIVQDAASPDKCEEIVSKQKDDGSIELDDSVCFELGAPKEDIITTIKKKITNEKLKSSEHSTSLSTAINLAYLKNAAS
ncbi:31551_t:CDS:1, partial [Gigaspora margarita]